MESAIRQFKNVVVSSWQAGAAEFAPFVDILPADESLKKPEGCGRFCMGNSLRIITHDSPAHRQLPSRALDLVQRNE